MARTARFLTIGLLGLALSGCASFSGPPPQTYDLAVPASTPLSGSASTRLQLLIAEPTAVQVLDAQQIAIAPAPLTLEYLSQAQWTDRLPRLVQLRLLQAFQNAERVAAVGVPGQGLAIDFQIVSEIRRFEIALDPAPSAVIEIAVKALNDRNGQVRAARTFRASVPVNGTSNDAYVLALNAAFAQVSTQIVGWSLELI